MGSDGKRALPPSHAGEPDKLRPEKTLGALPSPAEYYLDAALYAPYEFDTNDGSETYAIEMFDGPMDAYCPGCEKHTVFRRHEKGGWSNRKQAMDHFTSAQFFCTRDPSHRLRFYTRIHQGTIQKVGQFPPVIDLVQPDLKKYRSVLGAARHRELIRAVGLTTHGVGVGAFVYLRRIFESLIDEARQVAERSDGWNKDAYDQARMSEKIEILRDHLPTFLVENRKLYGIMSKGVHSLDEDECLDAFPVVKMAIELILDQRIEQIEREKKLREAQLQIEKLGKKFNDET